MARVLKNRTAHNHLSMRGESDISGFRKSTAPGKVHLTGGGQARPEHPHLLIPSFYFSSSLRFRAMSLPYHLVATFLRMVEMLSRAKRRKIMQFLLTVFWLSLLRESIHNCLEHAHRQKAPTKRNKAMQEL